MSSVVLTKLANSVKIPTLMDVQRKTIIFLPDGMADEPIEELGGRTPLQVAETPGMDAIASHGRSGTLLTLPEPFPTSSDVANMSVLGCDLTTEYCGRGVLEAASQGISLGKHDIAFRCNLVTVDERGDLVDFAGGHLSQEDAESVIGYLNTHLGTDVIRFYPGVSYRNLLVSSGVAFSEHVLCEKPDDNAGNPLAEHLPVVEIDSEAARTTLATVRRLIAEAIHLLPEASVNKRAVDEGRLPANAIWLWSPGRAGAMSTMTERYGVRGAVISAVDVIKGLGRCLGMNVIDVPGATGYVDTNYEGKAAAAIEAIKDYDLVYVHVEAIDEVSHARDLALKLQAIRDFDSKIVVPVMQACGDAITYAVLPDHPVPLATGRHTRTPVPLAIRGPGIDPDAVQVFSEAEALKGALGAWVGPDFMRYLYPEKSDASC